MASIQAHRGKFRCKWYDAEGRQRYKSFSTRPEAEAFKARVEATVVLSGAAPAVLDDDVLTLARWWDKWEPGRKWRDSSRNSANTHWRRWIKPTFGHMPVAAITTADINRWHRTLERCGLSPYYIAQINGTMRALLQGAMVDRLIDRNPVSDAPSLSRKPQSLPVAFSPSLTAAVIVAVEETTMHLGGFARLIAATGLRRSEAAGVTWDRINFQTGTLLVDRQLDLDASSAAKTPIWGPVKNSKRMRSRTVILTEAVMMDLRAQRSIGGLVFTRPDGLPWSRTQLTAAWQKAVKHLAAQGITLDPGARGWHALRHTVGSRLHVAGVPPVEAAAMLGQTTQEYLATYVHLIDQSAAHDRLRAALDG